MNCGACCAGEASGTEIVPADAAADRGVVLSTKPFDQGSPHHARGPNLELFGKVGGEAQPDLEPLLRVVLKLDKGDYPAFHVDLSECPFLRISKLEAYGPVQEYNQTVDTSKQIVVGDFIIAVNGVAGDGKEMMSTLGAGGEFDVMVSRAQELVVPSLDRGSEALGLDLTYQARSMSVVVKEVFAAGPVTKYNLSVPEGQRIQENDHIVSVCGKQAPSRQLVQALKSNSKLWLRLTRPIVSRPPSK